MSEQKAKVYGDYSQEVRKEVVELENAIDHYVMGLSDDGVDAALSYFDTYGAEDTLMNKLLNEKQDREEREE